MIDHRPGTEVTGTVDAFASHGAFIDVDGVRCYVPLSAMGEPQPSRARDVLTKDETRTFVVQAVDVPRRGIELGLPGFATIAGAPSDETVAAEVGRRRSKPKSGTPEKEGARKPVTKKVAAKATKSTPPELATPPSPAEPEPADGTTKRSRRSRGRGTQQKRLPTKTPAPVAAAALEVAPAPAAAAKKSRTKKQAAPAKKAAKAKAAAKAAPTKKQATKAKPPAKAATAKQARTKAPAKQTTKAVAKAPAKAAPTKKQATKAKAAPAKAKKSSRRR